MEFGRSGRILRIDLSNRTSAVEDADAYAGRFIGGRGINVKIVYDEVNPALSYTDPENRLVIGPGALTGMPVPTASRTKVTAMAPNKLLMSSGLGGFIGPEIRYAGYDNIVIKGKAPSPLYMYINDGAVEFRDAGAIWGKDTYETPELIKKEIGDQNAQVMCIGPAGENLVSFACIMTGIGSSAGHGGLGAVMGSKNLKAIAVRGKRGISIAHVEEFLKTCHEARKRVAEDAEVQAMVKTGGETVLTDSIRGGLAVFGNWENPDWNSLDLDGYRRQAREFWGNFEKGRAGCFGCPNHEWRLFDVPGIGYGMPKCAGMIAGGTPLWNFDRRLIFEFGTMCNKYGLGASSTANIITFLMELYRKGIISERDTDGISMGRGDPAAIMAAVDKIARQEGFGVLVKDGVLNAARKIGGGAEEFAMHVKGLEMQLYEYRPLKAMALSQAVAHKDHIDANPLSEIDELVQAMIKGDRIFSPSYENRAPEVLKFGSIKTITDLLGVCQFFDLRGHNVPILARLLSLATGVETSEEDLFAAARRVLTLERAFAVMGGIRRKDDTLPKRMFEQEISGGFFKGQKLDREKFEKMLDEYYDVCGWDADGIPKTDTFQKLDMQREGETFSERIKGRRENNG